MIYFISSILKEEDEDGYWGLPQLELLVLWGLERLRKPRGEGTHSKVSRKRRDRRQPLTLSFLPPGRLLPGGLPNSFPTAAARMSFLPAVSLEALALSSH